MYSLHLLAQEGRSARGCPDCPCSLNTPGPSGLFRKHVDTPRSENQVGSLVVCLPSSLKGGNLAVRHHGQEVEFDWSAESGSTIQWAAFYSDCTTEGGRITLTYNLYVTEPRMELSNALILGPRKFSLYEWTKKDILSKPEFMPEGTVAFSPSFLDHCSTNWSKVVFSASHGPMPIHTPLSSHACITLKR